MTEFDPLIRAQRAALAAVLGPNDQLADSVPFGTIAAPKGFDGANVTTFLDLTNLKPQATRADITALCAKAKAMGAATVCVNPQYVALAADLLQGSAVKAICVVGFPLGATLPDVVAYETRAAVKAGAAEVDMVLPVGMVKDGRVAEALAYIKAVVAAAGDVPVKVILETCKLTNAEVVTGCLLSQLAGAAFVKTSTGFSMDRLDDQPHTGATVARVRLMRRTVGDRMGVKASGGIKTAADATALLNAGADRLGASGLDTAGGY